MNTLLSALWPMLLIGAVFLLTGCLAAVIYLYVFICGGEEPEAATDQDAQGERPNDEGRMTKAKAEFVTVCAWCEPPVTPPPGVAVTHGICPACERKHFAELTAPKPPVPSLQH